MKKQIQMPHPGEHLAEFIEEFGLNDRRLALATGLLPAQVGQIRRGLRSITPVVALRLGRYFGTSAEFWMNLQTHFDLEQAREEVELEGIEPLQV